MRDRLVADKALALFQPDLLMPAQFFASLKHKAHGNGERRLMAAILADAIECFQKNVAATDGRGRQLCNEAERWFLSDDGSWLYSFVNICEALDIHPLFLRQGLLKWKTQKLAHYQSVPHQKGTKPVRGVESLVKGTGDR